MKSALLLRVLRGLLVGCFGLGQGHALADGPVTVRSQSGQFTVHGLPVGITFSRAPNSGVEYLRLDPTLTAISLERIRQAVVSELGLIDKVQGLITVTTQPVKEDHPPVRIAAVHYTDGWGYRVELPERIEKTRFFEVAVAVILGETANRSAGVREAELPPWLAEGLAAELLATSLPTLALEPGAEIARRERNQDPMRTARELLRQRPPLKFDELCMAEPDALDGEARATYRACAHLFVHELLRLRDGRASLREMLARLPRNLNWQTTFLQAFTKHFQRLIDVDKWYTLATLNLSGRDPMSVWPLEMSRRQLDETLLTRVQVRLETNELPIGASVSLQRIISEWDLPRQQQVLLQKINHLQALRLRAAPELVDLLDDYLQVLQSYTADRGFRGAVHRLTLLRGRPSAKLVIRRLDELDARRQVLGGQGSVRGEARRPEP